MQVYPTPSRSEQNRGIFIYHSLRWEPYFILFLSFMREVVSCCKGEWKAIQEKSANEGFIIQKTPNPWNRYFESQHFFSFSPFYPHFYIYYSYVSLIFLIQIFILFIFTSITNLQNTIPNQSRVGVGGNGGWWVSKLLFGGDSAVCQSGNSNGQWWFQMPIWYCMWEE